MKSHPKFSVHTIPFLKKASRQKRADWLERNQDEYERVLRTPLAHLARSLAAEVGPLARDYHFPQKGIGRLKRPVRPGDERGRGIYKSWMSYSASRPRESRFEQNPNLFFLINSEDTKDSVLVAGGLYLPSSKQLRAVREAVARDASAFDDLFATKEFSRCFPGGFSDERISSRPPRGFDPAHPRMSWLKLQAFFVWRPYSKREFTSADFPALVARDWKQIVRLNRLLEKAIQGNLPAGKPKAKSSSKLLEKLENVERFERKMDF